MLMFSEILAEKFGLKESVLITSMMRDVVQHQFGVKRNGRHWFTFQELKVLMPFWSSNQLSRLLFTMKIDRLIDVEQPFAKNMDQTKWFAVNERIKNEF